MRSVGPLRVAGFGRLLTSYTINELGDAVGIVALSVLVYERTRDPMATTAFFMAAKFLPALLSPLLTARIDQLAVGRALPALYGVEGFVFLLLALQVDNFNLVAVLALGLVDGTLALCGRGLSRGAVAAILGPSDQLRAGNGLMNIAFGVASVVGLAAGGVLASAASIEAALLVDTASFWLIALLLLNAPGLPPARSLGAQGVRTRVGEAIRYVRRTALVRSLLLFQAVALFFFTVVVPIEIVYAAETLGTDEAGFGALVASWAGGILVGSLLFVRVRRASPAGMVLTSSATIGVAYLALSAIRDLEPACVVSVVGGIGNGIQWVSAMTLLQEATPQHLQARIAGLLESVGAAVPGLGFLAGGALTSLASPPLAYLVAGIGTLVLVVIGIAARRSLPRFPEPQPELAPGSVLPEAPAEEHALNGRAGRWVTRALLAAAVFEAVSVTTGRRRRR